MDLGEDLLYPAFQKFYSALKCLEHFRKDNSFFDNISSLDTFFSEFRNITFVLQKSLAHTSYISSYESARETYLKNLHWFVDKRNEVLKERPFQLIKQIKMTVFLPDQSFEILNRTFSVEQDTELSSLLYDMRKILQAIHPKEVYFSACFSFREKEKNEDLWDRFIEGIISMRDFLYYLNEQIPGRCMQTEQIIKSIESVKMMYFAKDMFLVNDYVYYPDKDEFEEVERWGMAINIGIGSGKTIPRSSLAQWRNVYKSIGKTDFERFAALHVGLRIKQMEIHQELMPAFMIVFDDDTYEIDVFHANNKTTLYRKINETSQQVLKDNVKEVFFEYSMLSIANVPGVLQMTAKERQKIATEEWLVLLKIDTELNEEEYAFYVLGLKNPGYLKQQFSSCHRKLHFGRVNMLPIIEAFKKKISINQSLADKK